MGWQIMDPNVSTGDQVLTHKISWKQYLAHSVRLSELQTLEVGKGGQSVQDRGGRIDVRPVEVFLGWAVWPNCSARTKRATAFKMDN